MAVDKGYGSGKSRSAANSAARRRASEGKMTKGKKGIASKIKAANTARANSPLGQIADTVLGFALPTGKVKAAATGLRAAGKIELADVLGSRLAAKNIGKLRGKDIAQGLPGGLPKIGNYARGMSESVFPRLSKRSNVSEGTMNIVDTRRMNPAQAKSALEGGVNQTAVFKRRGPSAPKKVNKVTKRLLEGR
jgi:hypothetical protein